MTTEENLREEIGQTMMTFQFLEQSLRDYLDITMEIIKKNVTDPSITFSLYNKKDSLGTLVGIFKKVTDRQDIIDFLSPMPEKRNMIAHKIWPDFREGVYTRIKAGSTPKDIQNMQDYITGKVEEVRAIEQEAHSCMIVLMVETLRIKELL